MNTLIDFPTRHPTLSLFLLAVLLNCISALPTVEEFMAKPAKQLLYEWFYKCITGIAQMIPKQPSHGVPQNTVQFQPQTVVVNPQKEDRP